MSNIERRYAYHDDGVLPAQGEYGVTYLTLYSSGAGNVYDGWIYDPDGKTTESQTPRTFGYRNPDYPDYCWDDEVTIDLSNAQNRQESSEFEQGRITSFNTNVSDQPIILQDIDVTGMTEDQREARATTILFTALPLIKDAYIHAEVEVQMKMNISPNNTSGNVRVEAFYILNDESDRTMRPHPINHYTVTKTDEYNILRLLYWNPALNHENANYIGVKLIVSGGTAEIGISDDPDYGDAIITVTSAGMTGDNIFSGKPVSLEIYGKEYVPGGYILKEDDYTVLCTYDTGEMYDVTRLCTYTPAMGTAVIQPVITLIAEYMGLYTSMLVYLAQVESIELIGIEDIYEPYKLKLADFVVLAYFDTGDIWDVTDECTYSPAMGTTISQTTNLTATYEPFWMVGQSFTDTLLITKHTEVVRVPSEHGDRGLIYTLYDNNLVDITGEADFDSDDLHIYDYDPSIDAHEVIRLPQAIRTALGNNNYSLRWSAEGTPGGLIIGGNSSPRIVTFLGFKDVNFTCYYNGETADPPSYPGYKTIVFNFSYETELGSDELSFLNNVDEYPVCQAGWGSTSYSGMFRNMSMLRNLDFVSNWNTSHITDMGSMCKGCTNLLNVNGLSGWDFSNVTNADSMFENCTSLSDISGLKLADVTEIESAEKMFYYCESLESIRELALWNLAKLENAHLMFAYSGLKNLVGTTAWIIGNSADGPGNYITLQDMFSYSKIRSLVGLGNNLCMSTTKQTSPPDFQGCTELVTLEGAENFDTHNLNSLPSFYGCTALEDISAIASWRVFNAYSLAGMFGRCDKLKVIGWINDWDVSNCTDFHRMFYRLLNEDSYYFSAYGLFDETNIDKESVLLFDSNGILVVDKQNHHDPKTGEDYAWPSGSMFQGVDAFQYDKNTGVITYRHAQALPSWYKAFLDAEIPLAYAND